MHIDHNSIAIQVLNIKFPFSPDKFLHSFFPDNLSDSLTALKMRLHKYSKHLHIWLHAKNYSIKLENCANVECATNFLLLSIRYDTSFSSRQRERERQNLRECKFRSIFIKRTFCRVFPLILSHWAMFVPFFFIFLIFSVPTQITFTLSLSVTFSSSERVFMLANANKHTHAMCSNHSFPQ